MERFDTSQDERKASLDLMKTIFRELVENGRKAQFLPNYPGVPNIMEITISADDVCAKLYGDAVELIPEQGTFAFVIYCIWSAYAGMGAVMHWHRDWDTLSKNGIYETLTEPCGFDCMDEYVTDLIGVQFGTSESDKLVEHLKKQADIALSHTDSLEFAPIFAAAKAMYLYGMVFELYRIGLH